MAGNMRNIVILGAGTGGTITAARLQRALGPRASGPGADVHVTIVDRDDVHLYQPGLLFLPFGTTREQDLVRPRSSVVPDGVTLTLAGLERVDAARRVVLLGDGSELPYDVLVVATGAEIAPEATPGLTGVGWRATAFDFYTLDGARALAKALDAFQGGRLVLNVVEMPIKCPVAPLEFLLLADAYFRGRGLRERVELVYATPLDGAFTKPVASRMLGGLLASRGIQLETEFNASSVDGAARTLTSYDGRALAYDLLVSVPLHQGIGPIRASGLGDASGFVPTHKHTLQSIANPDIFVIGDATNVPASKAGAVAHFESEVLVPNILRFLDGRPLDPGFDGHANCFIETGDGKAMLVDFNYETEPLPGRYPLPGLGPFTLLEESSVNHWGKLGFRWVYWNLLLTGADLPLDHRMVMAGKWT